MGPRTCTNPVRPRETRSPRSRLAFKVAAVVFAVGSVFALGVPSASAAPARPGTWTMTQYRPIPFNIWSDWSTRIWHGATRVNGGPWAGRGLVCGGNDKSAYLLGEGSSGLCHTYDAATNVWRPVSASGAPARLQMSLDATADGRAVLFGGTYAATSPPGNETWIVTPTSSNTATWSKRAPSVAPPPRGGQAHATLADGRIVIFGGRAATYTTLGCALARDKPGWLPCRLDDTWIYDPSDGPQGSWKQVSTPTAPSKRDFAMMAPYDRGVVLFGGGLDDWRTDQSPTSDETWFLDPGSVDASGKIVGASWRLLDVDKPADFTPMSHGALTALGGGLFLQSAGYVHPYVCQHCAEYRVLDMAASPRPRWDEKVLPPWGGRDYPQAWPAGDGTVIMFGGQGNQNNEFGVWKFRLTDTPAAPGA